MCCLCHLTTTQPLLRESRDSALRISGLQGLQMSLPRFLSLQCSHRVRKMIQNKLPQDTVLNSCLVRFLRSLAQILRNAMRRSKTLIVRLFLQCAVTLWSYR